MGATKKQNIIKYDGKLTIAVGKSRFEKHWKNREMTWSELAEKLSETTRTRETMSEFSKMAKKQQDEIKDVGGFVGGTLKSGRRNAESTAWRQVVTLDADYADGSFWDTVGLFLGDYAALIYSTHKHTPQKPRLRLVLPLSRPVTPDEYQAIARRIAADIDIDLFDDTTYQPHRLMYWPSTPADGEYLFKFRDGVWLDADECLARYDDWTDQSFWPESSRIHAAIRKHVEKQEDPLGKKGLIGAFCRAYTLREALDKFLPGAYEPCADDRYTYTEGSTSAGAIVYDDKFIYSHHATDPISGVLCNAWDAVRLHKFKDLDDDAAKGTPPSRMPSYKAMQDLAASDDAVKTRIGEERLADAKADFAEEKNWMAKMDVNHWGRYENNARNVKLILENDPNLAGKMAIDDFAHRAIVLGDLPWREKKRSHQWGDADDKALRNYLDEIYDIRGNGLIDDGLSEIMVRQSFNPVKEYLESLVWDDIPRLDTLFVDYLGAEDTPFTRTVTRKALVAAVARVLTPGVKFDCVLTLIGKQGQGKSYILKKLGKDWHSDSIATVQGKEAMEQIQGFWIIELAELSAIKKAEFETTKQFITKQEDAFRAAYGKRTERYPRQCVFFATTNTTDFIRDQSGGRRWWPVMVDKDRRRLDPFIDLTEHVVDQIWAEAVYWHNEDEPLFLSGEMEKLAADVQEAHTEESPLAGMVREYLDRLLPENWAGFSIAERRDYIHGTGFGEEAVGVIRRERVCALEIWVELLEGDPKRLERAKATEINDILRKTTGWVQGKNGMRFGPIYGLQKGFIRVKKGVTL